MGPDAERSIRRLSHLQEIHADLLQKIAALAHLRKQIQRTEAALHAKIAYRKQRRKMQRTRNITLAMGPESLVGFSRCDGSPHMFQIKAVAQLPPKVAHAIYPKTGFHHRSGWDRNYRSQRGRARLHRCFRLVTRQAAG